MFTFGRDHEKTCEARYVRDPAQLPLLMAVVDAVHDLIEGKTDEASVMSAIRSAFCEGGAGVWECAGKWLRKTGQAYPSVIVLWQALASHEKAEIRFRVACFLDQMPPEVFAVLSPALAADRSKRVARMASARTSQVAGTDAA
jgi:hypothetical protein